MREGEFVSIIGPSGCGKTTLLKILAGIEDYQEGEVYFEGNRIFSNSDWRRSVIYQDIRLFPWMTARENIYFALENKDLGRKEAREVAERWMRVMEIDGFADNYPAQMSAGMRQKVGVCRVLASDPDLVLCDEPFSALDWTTREFLQWEILEYWQKNKKSVLFVTHNVMEAVYLAQRVVCMTARPGVVKEIVEIDLDRARWNVPRDSKKVLEASRYVARLIEEEVAKASQMERELGY
ncbi:MAG: ABC transporter ATP-binding protein [candidate division NC10 bacterium]|nr:ABC transporter ATP-binding protein [candidate division NC10 bacterium]